MRRRYVVKMLLLAAVLLCCGLCCGENENLGYSLNIGNSIDIFANYGDLSQVIQVVSIDYEDEDSKESSTEPFNEANIRIFKNASSQETKFNRIDDSMKILFCDTFEDLLQHYFTDFSIEGTTKSWKAFLGDWAEYEISRTLGIEYDPSTNNCCYVLAKLSKSHRSVKLDPLTGHLPVKDYVRAAMDEMNVSDAADVRWFTRNYGTHYIEEFVTGNFIYQVFRYKRAGYNRLKNYMNRHTTLVTDNLRFYFSSIFLKNVGDIRIASGNKTIENWAKDNLRDSQYLYSRPNILRLYYNPVLVNKLADLLDDSALLALKLKVLTPIFEDTAVGEKFSEIVRNDLVLWEVNK